MRQRAIVVAMWFAVSLAPASTRSQGAAAPTSCATALAAGMSAFDATRAGSMVGTFELIMIDTTSLRGGPRQHTGKLTLAFQDSVPKRRASMAKAVEQKFIVGVFEAALPDTGEMWSRMASRAPDAPGVFWADGFLRMGEFGPKSGVSLYVHSMGADELRGMWTTQAGTAVIVDFTGDKEPDEAGYFCARRVKAGNG